MATRYNQSDFTILNTKKMENNNNSEEKDKKNQPTLKKSGNDHFPQEYEEQRSENLRMKPQPIDKSKKE